MIQWTSSWGELGITPKRTFLIGRRMSFSDVVALKPQKLRLLLLVSVARTLEAMLLAYDNVRRLPSLVPLIMRQLRSPRDNLGRACYQ